MARVPADDARFGAIVAVLRFFVLFAPARQRPAVAM